MFIGWIYEIKNTVNNKIYVGSTRQGLIKRWKQHMFKVIHETTKLYNAMRAIGTNNFWISPIGKYECETLKQLHNYEGYFINKMDTINNGYNTRFAGKHYKAQIKDHKLMRKIYDSERRQIILKSGKFRCELHNMNFTYAGELKNHYESRKHKAPIKDNKDLKKIYDSERIKNILNSGKFRCELHNMNFTCASRLKKHNESRKHK